MKTLDHDICQNEITDLAHRLGCGVVREHNHCDAVVVPPYGAGIIAVEVERSARNVLRNISRNYAQGCERVLIVCPDFKTLGEVARKLSRHLPTEFSDRTAMVTLSALRLIQPVSFPAQGREARTERTL